MFDARWGEDEFMRVRSDTGRALSEVKRARFDARQVPSEVKGVISNTDRDENKLKRASVETSRVPNGFQLTRRDVDHDPNDDGGSHTELRVRMALASFGEK